MKVFFVTGECVPFVKTGGLADVCGALPNAISKLGHEVKIFLPLYASISRYDFALKQLSDLADLPIRIGDRTITFNTWQGRLPDSEVEVFFVDCPAYYHRAQLYTMDRDEDERFILLQHAVFNIIQHRHWTPDILHCHDWQSSLIPVYLRKNYGWDHLFEQTASILTLHNIGYQGRFPSSSLYKASLSYSDYYPGGPYELFDTFCFMKAGIVYADAITTVSETYAGEIQKPANGSDLDGILKSRKDSLWGIINGIDEAIWNPATDTHIPFQYNIDSLEVKSKNKEALLKEMNLAYQEEIPTIGIISRFAGQKGFKLLQPIFSDLLQRLQVQFVVLGSGESDIEDFFRWAAAAYPDQVATYFGYNDRLAHLIEAGCDMFLMPSYYEPCGLNQMYSLRYGTLPVVRKTGGLADTVYDYHEYKGGGNGFTFKTYTPYAVYLAILRAVQIFSDKNAWRAMQIRGMETDFSWESSAKKYQHLYQHILQKRFGTP